MRKSNGKFGGKVKAFRNFAVIIGLVYAGFYGYEAYINFSSPVEYRASQRIAGSVLKVEEAEKKPDYEKRIKEVKQNILDDLSLGCEVKGASDPDGVIIFDSNNEASLSRFQFQRKTVIYYEKMFYGKTITPHEAIAIAIDPVQSTDLAEKILFEDTGKGAENWHNCNKKMNIAQRVKDLKEIMEGVN